MVTIAVATIALAHRGPYFASALVYRFFVNVTVLLTSALGSPAMRRSNPGLLIISWAWNSSGVTGLALLSPPLALLLFFPPPPPDPNLPSAARLCLDSSQEASSRSNRPIASRKTSIDSKPGMPPGPPGVGGLSGGMPNICPAAPKRSSHSSRFAASISGSRPCSIRMV